ncbi:glutathione S-transferase [Bosea sp. (in: a-proteobacteria)]|jgi:glutathione S-transferase|uniref:glutathione S-transferase family protein n=1 Tax=Bosea sp. (in: a-proteobacteria) TaxID=1871050 RepID=UPI002DDD9D21|nr:glutathione S-transferase [Bosea sp. (in: a-proteobacteria)]HEV2511697.1 glutathione S-transferase [Bosea sp. (in: a-proteobacteria)]
MLTFYHSPQSRSFSILWLLEELGQPYEMEIVDIRAEGGPPESYRAIQPHKKVPAIVHDGITVTERAAICLYLTEQFPEAGLAPAISDKDRPAFLTSLVYTDAVLDPIIATSIHKFKYEARGFSFGSHADTVANLAKKLGEQPYAAGERFTAADTQLGAGIHFGMNIVGVLPRLPVFEAYMSRMIERPALQRTMQKDGTLEPGQVP